MDAFADLKRIQTQILRRITELETALLPPQSPAAASSDTTEGRRETALLPPQSPAAAFAAAEAAEAAAEAAEAAAEAAEAAAEAAEAAANARTLAKATQSYEDSKAAFALAEAASEAADAATKTRLTAILVNNGVKNFVFNRVNYWVYGNNFTVRFYDRQHLVGVASMDHVCQCIVLHDAEVDAKLVRNFLYKLNDRQMPKWKYTMQFAKAEILKSLTGFKANAVTCVGMKTDIPVILDEAIVSLRPDFLWLGGGEVDLDLRIKTSEFIDFAKPKPKPFIFKCSRAWTFLLSASSEFIVHL